MSTHTVHTCKQCGSHGNGKFCSTCGQLYAVKKITVKGILHEIFHFFTHLEKGFPYTLRKLITNPGEMQREYIEGQRVRHQKPFSMYFLSVTAAALLYYWINYTLVRYLHTDADELTFFNRYMVMLQIALVPVYSLITWIFFIKARYNYAETLVLLLYSFSMILLMAACIQLLKFIWPHLQTRYVELPLITIYLTLTNIRFFNEIPKWSAFARSVLATALCFLAATYTQDQLVSYLSR